MTPEQQQRADALFDALMEYTTADRGPLIAAEPDPEVRRAVEALLHYSGGRTKQMNLAIDGLLKDAGGFGNRTIGEGSRFGHYRIERRLGQGGMGEVYEAVREDDFHKRVALKVVRFGLDSEYSHRQFERERQVLAGLEHPYIARLIDGGEVENCPYLVLEFVEGKPIDKHCEGLSTEAILRLFLKVCEAVAHAHRSLIIHSDIKPANLMVSTAGEPKLLDFGIARLLNPDLDATQTRFAAMTPQYASPEQIRGEPVTTATDVYSLGIVLYELLSGRKPYTLASTSAKEMDQLICEIDPPAPGVSADIDNILMMALRKDPKRRYQSVQDFAGDIQRYLTNRPVQARADTFGYRTGKFLRRNWTGVAAGVALLLVIAAGIAATLYQARLANQRFEQVRKLAHSFVFDYDAELAKVEGNTVVREKMVRTALEYLDLLSVGATGNLDLQKELAAAYQRVGDAQGHPTQPSLGHVDQSIASYQKAARIYDSIVDGEPEYRRQTAKFYTEFTNLLRLTGDFSRAGEMGEAARRNLEALAASRPADDEVQVELARSWCVLGDVDEETNRTRSAFEKFSRCDVLLRGVITRTRNADTLVAAMQARSRVGTAAAAIGRLEYALRIFQEVQVLDEELLAKEPANPIFRRTQALLGQWRSTVYYDDAEPSLNDPARCLEHSRQYRDSIRQMLAHDPNNTSAQLSLAIASFRLSTPLKFLDPPAAVAAARESLRLFDQLIASGKKSYLVTSRRARALRRLSEALLADRQLAEASKVATEALAEQRKVAVHDAKDVRATTLLVMTLLSAAHVAEALGETERELGELIEAERLAAVGYDRYGKELTLMIPLSKARVGLAEHWKKAGDETQATQWFDAAWRLWREFPDQNDYVRAVARSGPGGADGK